MIYKLKQRIEPVRRRANTVAQTVFAEHSFAANYQALKAMEPNLTLLQGSSVRGILWRGTNANCVMTDCTVAFGLHDRPHRCIRVDRTFDDPAHMGQPCRACSVERAADCLVADDRRGSQPVQHLTRVHGLVF